jgi:hypothetical protein
MGFSPVAVPTAPEIRIAQNAVKGSKKIICNPETEE